MVEFCFALFSSIVVLVVSQMLISNEEYKKYVKFVVSLAVAVIMLSPIASLLSGTDADRFSIEFESGTPAVFYEDSVETLYAEAVESELKKEGIAASVLVELSEGRVQYARVTVFTGEEFSAGGELFLRARELAARALSLDVSEVYVYYEQS